MATLKFSKKDVLTLSQATEHLLDTIYKEMESTWMLNSEYNLVLHITAPFKGKQMSIWTEKDLRVMV